MSPFYNLALAAGLTLLYFFPSMIAIWRRHLNAPAIFLTDLLFGWTLAGWGIALIWAFTNKAADAPPARVSRWLKFTVFLTVILVMLLVWGRMQPLAKTSMQNAEAPVTAPAVPAPPLKTGVPVPADEVLGGGASK